VSEPLIYLDHAATTPLDPRVRAVMDECLSAPPEAIVFTSGATEADNLAIQGAARGNAARGRHLVSLRTEHRAVLDPLARLGREGFRVTLLTPGRDGLVDPAEVGRACGPGTTLVSVMLVNNETGVVHDLDLVAEVMAERAPRASLHTDAVQAFAWLDVAALAAPAQLVSVSGHKFGAPAGVGALVVREGTPLRAHLLGGGQERERRSGTPNVAGAVALATAARSAADERKALVDRVGPWRDRLVSDIAAAVPGTHESAVAGPPGPVSDRSHKVAGIAHLCFDDVESEALLFLLDDAGIEASAASSCASGALDPSHVLAAMGVDRRLARGSLRLSLGWSTVEADIEAALAAVPAAVTRLRSFA
jgi:cysteine desulfurase